MNTMLTRRIAVCVVGIVTLAACSGGSESKSVDSKLAFVSDVRAAANAVEVALGGPQEFFEITATAQLTNVFVATNDASSAVPYVYVDGELQSPAPAIDGVQGQTFTKEALDFDEATVLSGVSTDLPTATIDAFSVEGGGGGFARYVVSARSEQGGVLDIVVAPSGAVIEVNAL